MRVRKKDLEIFERRVNNILKDHNLSVKVSYRYNYTAIDIARKGRVVDTLIAGLTKREASLILLGIERIFTRL